MVKRTDPGRLTEREPQTSHIAIIRTYSSSLTATQPLADKPAELALATLLLPLIAALSATKSIAFAFCHDMNRLFMQWLGCLSNRIAPSAELRIDRSPRAVSLLRSNKRKTTLVTQ